MVTDLERRADELTFGLGGLKLQNMADVEMKATEWLWHDRLPLGKLVLVGGLPSTGKTTLVMSWIAAETSGKHFPLSDCRGAQRSVIVLSAEDDPADTLKPRLYAAGAEMSRVELVRSAPFDEDGEVRDGSFLLSRDLHALRWTLADRQDVSMIVFDPLSAYLGARDSHRDADVREVLGPLSDLASEFGVCVIGITHLNKNEGASAMARFMGSTAMIAAARVGFLAAPYEEDFILVPVKNNLAPLGSGVTYAIEDFRIDSCTPAIETSRTVWLEEVDIAADEVLKIAKDSKPSSKLNDAKGFLREELANGPRPVSEIEQAADHVEISWRTIERAKRSLGVKAEKVGFADGWHWRLPEHDGHRNAKAVNTSGGLRRRDEREAHIFDGVRAEDGLKTATSLDPEKAAKGEPSLSGFEDQSAPNKEDASKTANSAGRREVVL